MQASPGLGYLPFARHYLGNHYCFLFLRVLRCFSSPRMPSSKGVFPTQVSGMGCPIRTSADQRFFAAPRSFSQLGTSFIASVCLGIHRTLFSTFSLHGLHNICTTHTTHELDYVTSFDTLNLKESLLTGSPRITARSASIFILPQYVKELSLPACTKRKQEDCRGVDPLIRPIRHLAATVHLSVHYHNKKPSVELRGFEPRTPCLQSRCSSQLSYSPLSLKLQGAGP